MKKLLILLVLTLAVSGLKAQTSKAEVDYIQSIFGMEKKALIAEVVKPDEAKQTAFWTIYDEYEGKRKELGQKRFELLESYGDELASLTNEKAASLLKEMATLIKQNDKLLASYVKKVSKSVGPVVALQFQQVEMYVISELRVSLASGLPFPEVKR
nr:hypothetical protein [uncultured Carboxylicivirga sp.]